MPIIIGFIMPPPGIPGMPAIMFICIAKSCRLFAMGMVGAVFCVPLLVAALGWLGWTGVASLDPACFISPGPDGL